MNLREAYAGTAFANLDWSEIGERPIDRVAAAGWASELGVELWKAKYQKSPGSVVRACNGLLKRFKDRYHSEDRDMCLRVAHQCLLEYLRPNCGTCLGRGEVALENGVKIICKTCNGTQVKRYSDFERARSMKISLAKVRAVNHKIAWLAKEVQVLDSEVNRVLNEQLERVA